MTLEEAIISSAANHVLAEIDGYGKILYAYMYNGQRIEKPGAKRPYEDHEFYLLGDDNHPERAHGSSIISYSNTQFFIAINHSREIIKTLPVEDSWQVINKHDWEPIYDRRRT